MCRLLSTHARAVVMSVVLSAIVPAALVRAQGSTVVGTISGPNKSAAVNVLVSIAGSARYTDVQGRYRMDRVPFGRHKMRVAREGRLLIEVDVDVRGPVTVLNQTVP